MRRASICNAGESVERERDGHSDDQADKMIIKLVHCSLWQAGDDVDVLMLSNKWLHGEKRDGHVKE